MCKRCKMLDEVREHHLDLIDHYRKLLVTHRNLLRKAKLWLRVCFASYVIEDLEPNKDLVDLMVKVQNVLDKDISFYKHFYLGEEGGDE